MMDKIVKINEIETLEEQIFQLGKLMEKDKVYTFTLWSKHGILKTDSYGSENKGLTIAWEKPYVSIGVIDSNLHPIRMEPKGIQFFQFQSKELAIWIDMIKIEGKRGKYKLEITDYALKNDIREERMRGINMKTKTEVIKGTPIEEIEVQSVKRTVEVKDVNQNSYLRGYGYVSNK